MTTVSTKQELISAIERRETQIIATGEIAASIRKKVKVKKSAKIGGLALAIGGLLAIPFTGGASAGLTAAGLTCLTGAATLTGTQILILCGIVGVTAMGLSGKLKTCEVEFMPNGPVKLRLQYKD